MSCGILIFLFKSIFSVHLSRRKKKLKQCEHKVNLTRTNKMQQKN